MTRKKLASLLLFAHLFAIAVANFAPMGTRTTHALYRLVAPYVHVTGLGQNWSMYQRPKPFDARIEVVSVHGDGCREHPLGTADGMPLRRLYFLENLFAGRPAHQQPFADAVLRRVEAQSPDGDAPRMVQISCEIRDTPPPGSAASIASQQYKPYHTFTLRGTPQPGDLP